MISAGMASPCDIANCADNGPSGLSLDMGRQPIRRSSQNATGSATPPWNIAISATMRSDSSSDSTPMMRNVAPYAIRKGAPPAELALTSLRATVKFSRSLLMNSLP
jgi:hypothetical protein